ncbi:MAG TPA: DUF3592 domain-containing protein [Trebonia sp.]|jgi:hypothetical protein
MSVTHWDSQEWQRNLDELVADPAHPLAFPAENPADLMGRLRVKLRAGDRALEAYGFGGQKLVIPRDEIKAIRTVNRYRFRGREREQGLLVLDHGNHVLLRADGLWETYGEVARVCRAAGLPAPTHEYNYSYKSSRNRARSLPYYSPAPGYQRLRRHVPGYGWLVLLKILVWLAVVGVCAFIGFVPAAILPEWIGAVRVLLGIAGVALGICAGLWVCGTVSRLITDGLRWIATSRRVRGWAPPRRFFGGVWETEIWGRIATAALVLSVPACVIWGPGVGLVSAVHGLQDSALVADLRANGVRAPGHLIDVPVSSTDSDGNEQETDVATLSFTVEGINVQATDPAIRGQALPLDSGDPLDTSVPVTVVYDPDDSSKAATVQQITGSVWHGAPTANEIVGGLLTAALPFALLAAIFRVNRRRQRGASILDNLADNASGAPRLGKGSGRHVNRD